jgi:hypothetical protein
MVHGFLRRGFVAVVKECLSNGYSLLKRRTAKEFDYPWLVRGLDERIEYRRGNNGHSESDTTPAHGGGG